MKRRFGKCPQITFYDDPNWGPFGINITEQYNRYFLTMLIERVTVLVQTIVISRYLRITLDYS